MSSSSSPALTPRTIIVLPGFPPYAGPSIPPGNIPHHRLSIHGVNRLRRFGHRSKLPNGSSNADCARFRLRRKQGPIDQATDLQRDMVRSYGVQRRLEAMLVPSMKRIVVTTGRIRQCRQVPVDPTPFLILRQALLMENMAIRQYRDRFRALRWKSARMLALMDRCNARTSTISALILQYRSTLPFPTFDIQSPSSHPTVSPVSQAHIPPFDSPFGPPAHSVHRVGLKRSWNMAFSLTVPSPSSAAFVDFDGAAQQVAVGSSPPSDDVLTMTRSKRPRI